MPPTTTAQMGEQHEIHLAEINGGRKSKSSGNQWDDPGDGRDAHDDPFNFCWDGKSTLGKSISVTREMLAKIREQAGGERPQIGLRWYETGDLSVVAEDWIAVPDVDFEEMKIAARNFEATKAAVSSALAEITALRGDYDKLINDLAAARAELAVIRGQAQSQAADGPEEGAREIPGWVPELPWTVVLVMSGQAAGSIKSGFRYEADGRMIPMKVGTVRVERSAQNRPRLIVDDVRISSGDLYINGVHSARVWVGQPGSEHG
jgi:hypothetical protein